MKKLVLFDIDGTLLNHKGDKQYWKQTFKQVYHIDADVEEINYFGMIDSEIIVALARMKSVPDTEIDSKLKAALAALGEYVERRVQATEIQVLPGVLETLRLLQTDPDILIGLLTGNERRKAWAKLRLVGLDQFFALGAFGDEALERATLVTIAIDRAEAMLGQIVPPANVFVVGDTPRDVACAKANGVVSVAVAAGNASLEELRRAEPDFLLNDFGDGRSLYQIIKNETTDKRG
jgi:phosphoglycolate phosphatase-like HAD superfamily hydrolase